MPSSPAICDCNKCFHRMCCCCCRCVFSFSRNFFALRRFLPSQNYIDRQRHFFSRKQKKIYIKKVHIFVSLGAYVTSCSHRLEVFNAFPRLKMCGCGYWKWKKCTEIMFRGSRGVNRLISKWRKWETDSRKHTTYFNSTPPSLANSVDSALKDYLGLYNRLISLSEMRNLLSNNVLGQKKQVFLT